MFKNNNTSTHRPISESGNQPLINIISEGTVIKGEIITENDFRISGKVNGTLEVKGKCIITNSGLLNGELRAKDADISGKMEGNLVIENKLFLRSNARVTGDIYTKSLLIEEGALFDGSCHMSKNPLSVSLPKHTDSNYLQNQTNSSDKIVQIKDKEQIEP